MTQLALFEPHRPGPWLEARERGWSTGRRHRCPDCVGVPLPSRLVPEAATHASPRSREDA